MTHCTCPVASAVRSCRYWLSSAWRSLLCCAAGVGGGSSFFLPLPRRLNGASLTQRDQLQLLDLLLEKLAGDAAESLRGIGDQKDVWSAAALGGVFVDRLSHALRRRLRAVNDRDLISHYMLDRSAEDGIVRASQ